MARERPMTLFPGSTDLRLWQPKIESEGPFGSKKRKGLDAVAIPPETADFRPAMPRRVSRPVMRIQCRSGSPWEFYERVFSVAHTGSGIVAVKHNPRGKTVFIKQTNTSKQEDLNALKSASHENILALTAAYFHNDSIYLVYNYLPFTLQEIVLRYLTTVQIATVCNAIANGLAFLHGELKMVHGNLHAGNVVLGRDGQIKLADVGEVMLRKPVVSRSQDEKALGKILRALLEPSVRPSDTSYQLKNPDDCDDAARDFLEKLQKQAIDTLLEPKHPFLQKADSPICLVQLLLVTEELRLRDIDVLLTGSGDVNSHPSTDFKFGV